MVEVVVMDGGMKEEVVVMVIGMVEVGMKGIANGLRLVEVD